MNTQTTLATADTLLPRPPPTKMDRAIGHFSRFSGLAVAQLYLLCALVTVYEVVMRYVFNAPTQWAFEVVMVFCATAWMLSAGYITFHKRHIGITVIYLMVSENKRWWLDLTAMIVGVKIGRAHV